MKNFKFLLIVLFCTGLLQANPSADSTVWQLQLKGSVGVVYDYFNFLGFANNATEGFDPGYDVPKPPLAPGNYISVYFYHPDWNLVLGQNYATDIKKNRQLSDTVVKWRIEVKTNIVNDTVKLSFTNDRIPPGYGRCLRDSVTGNMINIKNDSVYKYYNTSTSPRVFFISIGDSSNIIIPPVPLLSEPLNNSVGNIQPIFVKWNKTVWGKRYNLQVSSDSLFNTFVVNESNLLDTFKTLPCLAHLNKYFWRVNASNLEGTSAFSTVWNFKTLGTPTRVLLSTPISNATNQPINLTFKWFNAVDQVNKLFIGNKGKGDGPYAVSNYWFEFAMDSLFTNLIIKDSTLTDTTKTINGLSYSTEYYWRVKARNEVGWGDFSITWNFTTMNYYFLTVNVLANWNIISAPLVSPSMKVDSLFPGALSQAFGYNNGYVQTTTLSNSKGYWLKFGSAGSYDVFGLLYSPQNIPLVAGWNLIGPFDNNITVANIVTNPPSIITSLFFGYNNGYQSSTTLNPGKGYWVKTNQAGTIILSSEPDNTQIVQQNNKQENPDNSKSSWTRVRITDAKNYNTMLYLARSNEITSNFELPPIPPQGIFDARFASQNYVETSGKSQEVKITSAKYPIQISAENMNGMNLRLKDKVTGKIINEELAEGKIITIYQPIETFDIIDDNALPTTYNLEQNYPNPFNPVTTIKYQIPKSGVTTIKIYDIIGREMMTLVNRKAEAGYYKINFNATNISSGVYFYKMVAGDFVSIKKFVVLK